MSEARRGTAEPGTRRSGRGLLLAAGVLLATVLGFVVGRATDDGVVEEARPGVVDVGFSQDMSIHHDQAVLMASLANDRGGVSVRAVAAGILGGQARESGAMRGWLAAWGAPATSNAPMAWMSDEHVHHAGYPGHEGSGSTMPGMAAGQELTELWTSSGDEFDAAFLRLMIRHHQGGVVMAADAAERATLDLVRDTAAAMRFHQAEEIGLMQALLDAHEDQPR